MIAQRFAAVLALLACTTVSLFANDGGPADFGPADTHAVDLVGVNQPILVIYAQANDHRILPSELAALNATETQELADARAWYAETSWAKTTFDFDAKRSAGGNWYLLPEGILDYASPSAILAMEARDATAASGVNPTPPASLSASSASPSGGDPDSDFAADEAGDYRYAVSSFKNGIESTLTRLPYAVSVAAGDVVTLTIAKAASNDVDRFMVYRTGKGQSDALGNYKRIGYAPATASAEYRDVGRSLAHLADHAKLLTEAMTAASADVPNFEAYKGVIVVLYSSFLRGQAAGAQTYTVNGTSFKIQTINQSSETGFGRFTHEMGHWLTLPDQYDPKTASARGYWTTMDGSNDLEYAGWEKDYKLAWIAGPDHVKVVERPGPGQPDLDQTFKLAPTALDESAADTYTALKIESSASVNYYVEGRDHIAGNISDIAASDKVVAMEAVDAWPPGIYPKRTLNGQRVMSSGDPSHRPDATVEIEYTGINGGPSKSYNVRVKVKAEAQPDPSIAPWGAPPWESPDIWVDSEREGSGWDNPATATPKPSNGEAAWVNHVNRIYARVTNLGGADALGVKVRFRVNTPGGIGDAGQFVDLPSPAGVDIPAGQSRNVYAEWTPTVGDHTCIQVEIEHIAGEKDIYNDFAQENVGHFYTGNGSPWKQVKLPVRVANPYDEAKRIDLEIAGLEPGWTARVEKKWLTLNAKGLQTLDVGITPPADAPRCTRLKLDLYAMTQIDDYIQVYGGVNPIIHLANPVKFEKLHVRTGRDTSTQIAKLPTDSGQYGYWIAGTMHPALVGAEIAVIATGPSGRYSVYFTRTDAGGGFERNIPVDETGAWSVQTYYAGDDCNAPTESDGIRFQASVAGVSDSGMAGDRCCRIVVLLLLLVLLGLLVLYAQMRRLAA